MGNQRAVFYSRQLQVPARLDERSKSTQPNVSPSSSTHESVRSASRTRSPRGSSPCGRMSRLACKDYLKGICTIHSLKKGISQNVFLCKTKSGCRFGEVLSCASPGSRTAQQNVSKEW